MPAITVLTGGTTPERDVALAGAAQVVAALRRRGHAVAVVDTVEGALGPADEARLLVPTVGTAPPPAQTLAALAARELGVRVVELPELRRADVVFLVLHGREGEGGQMQTLLDSADICYTGSGPLGSALAMDKDIAKRLFRAAGVPTPDWLVWPAPADAVAALGTPLIVKPSKAGSTVGLTLVHNLKDLDAALREALRFDDEVILEQYAAGREFTVGVLGEEPLAVGEIVPEHEIFDYECKYTPGKTAEIFPADLPADLADRLRSLALAAHRTLKLRDFSRVDFRLGHDGAPLCLEVNTLPGLTRTSLLPQSAAAHGIPFDELCERIGALALARAQPRNKVGVAGM